MAYNSYSVHSVLVHFFPEEKRAGHLMLFLELQASLQGMTGCAQLSVLFQFRC